MRAPRADHDPARAAQALLDQFGVGIADVPVVVCRGVRVLKSRPGVFAVGDVRANSTKRVASAVGEGSVCIQLVHKVFGE